MTFAFEPLDKRHDRHAFSCGEPALDRYFQEQVTQDTKRRVTSCFVALQGEAIAGFYTIASASIPVADLPEDIARRLPRYPVMPAIRIGRLAVDRQFQKQGVGGLLLVDAMRRALGAEQANYTIIVDAKNENAVKFYQHHGFIGLKSCPATTLILPLATAEKLLPPYLHDLSAYGITTQDVAEAGCYPYELATWRLRQHILHDKGDLWTKAANYHSRTSVYNIKYRAKIKVAAGRWAVWLGRHFETKVASP